MEFLELAARGKTAWWRYGVAVILALLLWIAGLIAIFIPILLFKLAPSDFSQLIVDPSRPAFFYGATGLMFGLLVLALALAAYLMHRKTMADIIGRWRWSYTLTAAGLWLVFCVAAALLDYGLRPSGFRVTLGSQWLTLALWAAPSLAIQTFAEEFIFRGYITQGLLLAVKRPLIAAAISSVIFATAHIPNGVPEAVNALAFGFVTALIAMRTGGIAFTWGLHFTNNLFAAVVVVSTSDVLHGSPAIITQATPGLMWFDVAAACVGFAAIAWAAVRVSQNQAMVGALRFRT